MPEDSLPTRETLILRLRDSEDDASWREFVEIYTPLLFGYCRKRGLSAEDASDVVQEVMRSVALAMKGFEYDPSKGKFKGWLFTAVRNAIGRHFKKQSRLPLTAADTRIVGLIEQAPDPNEVGNWEEDYQIKLLGWAMEKVKPEFAERIWAAFEQTAVQGRAPDDVAVSIGMSKNAVAIAKHRVIKRLREKAQSVDADQWEGEVIGRLQRV